MIEPSFATRLIHSCSGILVLSGMWIIRPGSTNATLLEYFYIGVIVIFFIISNVFLFTRIRRKKKGLPIDDELSKIIDQKASSSAYFVSVLIWLSLVLLQFLFVLEVKWLLALGMIGMAFSYFISWLIINSKTYKK